MNPAADAERKRLVSQVQVAEEVAKVVVPRMAITQACPGVENGVLMAPSCVVAFDGGDFMGRIRATAATRSALRRQSYTLTMRRLPGV
eukprot:CAMPEP_0197914426 /NCGR_PEP_ID=MMETSP1439-20131203/78472_1 /TAXON_ID=66791 /ORGANISM="Gonyaulax spinifera, Strain CCMP409" /LENGTH=87 /DNA_ID=CAMNT_0043536335 /DNA_START=671 /DNA_END=935 /DNA_ORIENTATION=-